jgi:DNA-binding transcriptional regulator YiaG
VPYETTPKTFEERIVISRRIFGITQEELALRLGVDSTTLGRWERGKSKPLKRHMAELTAFLVSRSMM